MLTTKLLEFGKIRLNSQTYENIGDTLPMHNHLNDPAYTHITIVSRGSFIMRGNGWEKTVIAGDIIDWQPEIFHEFESLEPNSKLANITK